MGMRSTQVEGYFFATLTSTESLGKIAVVMPVSQLTICSSSVEHVRRVKFIVCRAAGTGLRRRSSKRNVTPNVRRAPTRPQIAFSLIVLGRYLMAPMLDAQEKENSGKVLCCSPTCYVPKLHACKAQGMSLTHVSKPKATPHSLAPPVAS